jgi:putative copper export protein
MNWLQFAVQWLHVLFAIAWFGTVIGINVVVMPRVMTMAPDRQREFMQGFLASQAPHVFGLVTIALGLIRGTLLGPIQSIDFLFGTAYGRTWLVALVAALYALIFPYVVMEPRMRRILATDDLWRPDVGGGRSPELEAAMKSTMRMAPLGILGLLVAFTCMILMRFGL